MAEKAGLCNICTELAAENFIRVDKLLAHLGEMLRSQGKPDLTPELMSKAKKLRVICCQNFSAILKFTVAVPLTVLVFGFQTTPPVATSLNTRKLAKAPFKYLTQ